MDNVQRIAGDEPAPGRRYTLVVAVANPGSVRQLMRTATDLARARDGQIRVTSVIHKHASSPFRLFAEEQIKREFAGGRAAVLEEAVAAAEAAAVPVQQSLVVGTDVSDALRSEVADADADALLLGWQGRPSASDVVLGTTVDPLLRRAPCDTFVERVGTTADGVDAILLPTDGGPHVEAAADLAGAVARANEATVRVASYLPPDADEADRRTARDHVGRVADRLSGAPIEIEIAEADDAADAIVSAAADHDFVVLGATREHRFRQRTVGSVARAVARRSDPPIVIARCRADESLFQRALGRLW